jgi:hypothetical protein
MWESGLLGASAEAIAKRCCKADRIQDTQLYTTPIYLLTRGFNTYVQHQSYLLTRGQSNLAELRAKLQIL